MTLRETLIIVANHYAQARRLSMSRVSTLVLNDGKALDRISSGGDLNTGSYERALEWFSANWPRGAAWPEGVERPQREAAE